MVPFIQGDFVVGGLSTPAYRSDIYLDNADGSNSGISVAVTAGVDGSENYAEISFQFYGRVLALRWQAGVSSTTPRDFTCVIDGVPYAVTNQIYDPANGQTLIITPAGNQVRVIDDNLPDGVHQCRLVFPGASDQTNRWTLYGYAVESRLGLAPYRRFSALRAPSLLTTSMAIPTWTHQSGSNSENNPRAVAGIQYYNSATYPVTVTLETLFNGIAGTATPLDGYIIPPGEGWLFTLGKSISTDLTAGAGSRTIRHKASVDGVVSAFVIGER